MVWKSRSFALMRKRCCLTRITFALCLLAGVSFFVSLLAHAQHEDSFDTRLKRASDLFKQRNYKEALPILEKLAADNPSDDQAVFGLAVALVMTAPKIGDPKERKQMIARAGSALKAAEYLGVENFFLDFDLMDLLSSRNEILEDVRTQAIGSLASLWVSHPPLVFDNPPPKGIRLPDGYRHKNSRDFEGSVGGEIWKPSGLKITYEFAGQFQTDAITRFDKGNWAWYQERIVGDHKFKCLLTKDNWLVISVMIIDTEEYAIAEFGCQINNKEEIKEVLSIVCGFEER